MIMTDTDFIAYNPHAIVCSRFEEQSMIVKAFRPTSSIVQHHSTIQTFAACSVSFCISPLVYVDAYYSI